MQKDLIYLFTTYSLCTHSWKSPELVDYFFIKSLCSTPRKVWKRTCPYFHTNHSKSVRSLIPSVFHWDKLRLCILGIHSTCCFCEHQYSTICWFGLYEDSGGGGYLVERWVRGCAAQIRCFFGLSGLPMAPFLFENWFRYRSRFCKMHNFLWIFPLVYL